MKNYLLATNRPWVLEVFLAKRNSFQGNWSVCVSQRDLQNAASETKPRYVFFPHWSHIVPEEFLKQNECVCFHMTDVPFGRGGSPLQNLIARGHRETVLTALRMTAEIDAGPFYMKRPLSLEGTARDIFRRAAELSMDMIGEMIKQEPAAAAQSGTPVFFKRRKPEQSEVPKGATPMALYDHIRMLDAPGYPHAFLRHGPWVARFTDARLNGNTVEALVRFERAELNEAL